MGFIARAVGVVVLGALVGACADEPTYSETNQKAIVVNPPSQTFPNTQVGASSGPLTFTVDPADFTYNSVTSITEDCNDFSVEASLPQYLYYDCDPSSYYCDYYYYYNCYCYNYIPYGQFSFNVYYSPVVAATTSCTISVNADTGTYNISVSGTGTPPPAQLSAGPGAINFGEIRRNTQSGPAAVQVHNAGGLTMNVGSVTVGGGPFVMNTTAGTQVGGGQTATYYVYCSPTAVGATSGTVTVSTDAGSANIPVYCSGIDSNLDLAPSPAQVPVTRVGEPRMQTISLANTGAAGMNVESIALTGDPKLALVGAMPTGGYGPSVTNSLQVQFMADAPGTVTGELRVTYDGGQARTVAISATAQATAMSVTPDTSYDLGQVCAGSSTSKEFNVLGTQAGPFKVTDVVPPAEPFTLLAPDLPADVQGNGGNMYKFTVGVAPTDAGEFSSEINVTTDIPGGTPREIKVHAIAIPEGVNGPSEVMLGGAPLGTTTLGRAVSITNCSAASTTLSGGHIEGGTDGEFAIVQEPTNATAEPGESVEWLVVFRPSVGGTRTANFVAQDSSGATITIPLTGDGLTEEIERPEDDAGTPSYYACSTGNASTAWPLAFALPLIVRRRRR